MKAIFLDIDGVIATPASVRLSYLLHRGPERQLFDPIALHHLGRLVRRTGVRVVISSNWRDALQSHNPFMEAVMDNVFAQLARAGAPVADVTPRLETYDRSDEIGAWLDEHPCETWVIFDDLATFERRPEVVEGHLVRIEGSDGIRRRHASQALSILEGRPAMPAR